jgi:hypothetical protein
MAEVLIGLGAEVQIVKGDTLVVGRIDGMKLVRGEVERVSLEEIDYWFYMDMGWKFLSEEGEKDAEIQPE